MCLAWYTVSSTSTHSTNTIAKYKIPHAQLWENEETSWTRQAKAYKLPKNCPNCGSSVIADAIFLAIVSSLFQMMYTLLLIRTSICFQLEHFYSYFSPRLCSLVLFLSVLYKWSVRPAPVTQHIHTWKYH